MGKVRKRKQESYQTKANVGHFFTKATYNHNNMGTFWVKMAKVPLCHFKQISQLMHMTSINVVSQKSFWMNAFAEWLNVI